MRRIELAVVSALVFALLHAWTQSDAWSQDDLLSQQRAISAIKRIGGVVERYGDGSSSVAFRLVIPVPKGTATDLRPAPTKPAALIDSELRHLKSVPHLKGLTLYVDWVRFSDAALEHVRGLKELESLHIAFLPLGRRNRDEPTITGLKSLQGHGRLESLSISLANLGGAALNDIKDLPCLVSLRVMGYEVTDSDLRFLQDLKSLGSLSLRCPRVTDKALVWVKNLSNLRSLDLHCPEVTEKGIKELKRALPRTQIER